MGCGATGRIRKSAKRKGLRPFRDEPGDELRKRYKKLTTTLFVNINCDTPLQLPPDLLGFRHSLLRGLEKVSLEWTLVTLAYDHHRETVLKKT